MLVFLNVLIDLSFNDLLNNFIQLPFYPQKLFGPLTHPLVVRIIGIRVLNAFNITWYWKSSNGGLEN